MPERQIHPAAVLIAAALAFPALSAPSAALAAVLQPGSRLTAVTVYPDAALLRREIALEVPAGSHEILIPDLPATLDPTSLRVEGAAEGRLVIGSLDLRNRAAAMEESPQRVRKLAALRLEKDRLSDRLDAIEGKKAMILRSVNPSEKDGRLDPGQWPAAWETVGKGLQATNDELRALRNEEARIEAEIAALENPEALRGQNGATRHALAIGIEAQGATRARLTLSYRVRGAGWRPVYDARLITRGTQPTLELVRRALLRQDSGEDWQDAQLTLATSMVGRGTSAPRLEAERIGFAPPPAPPPAPRMKAEALALSAARAPAPFAPQADAATVEESSAAFEAGDFQGEFRLPGAVSLPSGGGEKSFRLGVEKPEIALALRAVPLLDPTAYLEAAFTVSGEAPLLPGEVQLMRDDAFIGKTRLALTAPGETARLGFGADDAVKIKRVTLSQKTTEAGLLSASKSARSEFRITVKNLHPFAVAMVIEDRLPVSEDQAITVERAPEMSKPDVDSPEERRGIMQWKPQLKGGEEKSFTIAYTLRWPADRLLHHSPLPR